MKNIIICLVLVLITLSGFSQVQVDLSKSVPTWLEYNSTNNEAILKWIADPLATQYEIREFEYDDVITTNSLGFVDGTTNEYSIGAIEPGQLYGYQIDKTGDGVVPGMGLIYSGIEIPAIHERGRCLIAIDDTLSIPLTTEINQFIHDIRMDGWEVDTLHIKRSQDVVTVKSLIQEWYISNYEYSQSLILLGRIAVPYSGNYAYDGHTNHQGAWSADTYYAELDGSWTDNVVNNITPSRDANKNIPGDGKFDQTGIPGQVELEVGRIDFYNLPAFEMDEIELTRKYLIKNHAFRIGDKDFPRRAIIENNFSSFSEGFGQSGWRSYVPMFGEENVIIGNYDGILDTSAYLCSYACGGGSYTSMSGVGSTANLWATKDLQTVFTMNFGSYFGDWDSQNNFLRSALASGDVLTNAWAGRPVWHLYRMALGKHIGFCTKESQNATTSNYNQGFGSHSTHMGLMGDPTLRLHPVKPAKNIEVSYNGEDISITWEGSEQADNGYFVYRKLNDGQWELIASFLQETSFIDQCAIPNTDYSYMVKAIKLENSASGSYYNTSLGIMTQLFIEENMSISTYFADGDMDGFGDPNNSVLSCVIPPGFADNDLDCDDTNPNINPDAPEIPNNGIDEDCKDGDLITSIDDISLLNIDIFPNPTSGIINVEGEKIESYSFIIYDGLGKVLRTGPLQSEIDIMDLHVGYYWLEITDNAKQKSMRRIIIKD